MTRSILEWEKRVQRYPATMQGTLEGLRMVHGILMFSIVLYVVVMRMIPAQGAEPLSSRLLWSLGACAAASLAVGQVIRSRYLRLAFERCELNLTTPDLYFAGDRVCWSAIVWRKLLFCTDSSFTCSAEPTERWFLFSSQAAQR
jgi:hypothetical protein